MKVIALSHPTSTLNASIHLPASKSISNRALILNAVTGNTTLINNLSEADDTVLMQSVLLSNETTFNLKNAGTCMRFLTAYFAANPGKEVTLLCDERMEQRPIHSLVEALRQLGADITYLNKKGFPPLAIKGKQLSGGIIRLNASESSQFTSALMMIAPLLSEPLTLQLQGDISSEPYLKMTAAVMRLFGLETTIDLPYIHLTSQISNLESQILIEPDWSSASYWYEIVALSKDARIDLPGLSIRSLQGDAIIAQHMIGFGVETIETDLGITLKKTSPLKQQNLILDLTHCPDLAPALAVTAAACNRNTTLTGLKNLAIKESNRLLALHTELTKLGFDITITDDELCVKERPQSAVSGSQLSIPKSQISTHGDHRLAMAFAPLALVFPSISVEQPEVVEKSYPHFWEDLKTVGFTIGTY
jgi:3-phosphoshikimate 1-carboxyvinyltransferase